MKGFKNYQSPWILAALLLIGGLLGSLLGEALGPYIPLLRKSTEIGFPATPLNLHVVKLTLGFLLKVNLMTVLGFLLGFFLFRKL